MRIPLLFGIKLFEEARLAGGKYRDGHAIPIQHPVAREGGQPRAGREQTNEVQWVRSGYRHVLTAVGLATYVAQQSNSFRRGELLAREARDKTAAADFTTGLQTTAAH